MRCEEEVKILEVLRLWEMGLSQRQIADSVKCGKTTVGELQGRCKDLGIDYTKAVEIAKVSDIKLQTLIYPALATRNVIDAPNWQTIHDRLMARRRLNLKYIWEEEYRNTKPDAMSYSQFCRRYSDWLWDTGKNVVMAMERKPGYELCVDWAGDILENCVLDTGTGELLDAHIFVATLGDSGYPYAEGFPDETHENWIRAHIHALEWIAGVPAVIKPDNCKTAITKANYYDPVINKSYLEFSKHYNVAIVPARVRRPKDKSVTEGSIGYFETWLMEWLFGKKFNSYENLNIAIKERVGVLAKKGFQKRAGNRDEVYRLVDKPALRPLPAQRYENAEYVKRIVPDNYHVEWGDFYYSVPFQMYRQTVFMRITSTMVEILDGYNKRVTLHKRRRTGNRYVTDDEHMPERHRKQRETDRQDGASYRKWASSVGPNTASAIDMLLRSKHVEQVSYRSCMGILQMKNKYGREALEAACGNAVSAGDVRYASIKSRLESPIQTTVELPLPRHENLREPSEFH